MAEIIGHLYPYTADLQTVDLIITLYDDGAIHVGNYLPDWIGEIGKTFFKPGLTARELADETAQVNGWVLRDKPFNNARNCETCLFADYHKPVKCDDYDEAGNYLKGWARCTLNGMTFDENEIIQMGIRDCSRWHAPQDWPA